jgi:hypothetical protein
MKKINTTPIQKSMAGIDLNVIANINAPEKECSMLKLSLPVSYKIQ